MLSTERQAKGKLKASSYTEACYKLFGCLIFNNLLTEMPCVLFYCICTMHFSGNPFK